MKYITLPDSRERRLSFYLAMEEYAARIMVNCETDFVASQMLFSFGRYSPALFSDVIRWPITR